jgi:hypothetical protein
MAVRGAGPLGGAGFRDGAGRLVTTLKRVLTTELAEQVRDLEVLSPVRLLGDGTTLLDTPGFSVSNRGHHEPAGRPQHGRRTSRWWWCQPSPRCR